MSNGNASIETGQFGEFTAAVVSQLWAVVQGLTPATLQRFIEDRPALRSVLERAFATVTAVIYPFTHKFPWWNDKCKVLHEGTPSTTPTDFTKLEVVSFHHKDEDLVGGEEMLRRANDKETFPGCQGWGMHQGDELYARRNEIPEAMRAFVLLLPDTVLQGEGGGRCIACLVFGGGGWQFGWGWVGGSFDRGYRFVRLSK